MSTETSYAVSGGFGAIASAFIMESLAVMIPWILAMGAIVCCDLIAGTAKCYKLRIKIRPSKFIRDSLAKFLTYFASVVAACFLQVANGGESELARYAVMFCCLIEIISIAGNIMKMKGYDMDFNKVLSLIISKKIDCAREDIEDIITKSGSGDEEDKPRDDR